MNAPVIVPPFSAAFRASLPEKPVAPELPEKLSSVRDRPAVNCMSASPRTAGASSSPASLTTVLPGSWPEKPVTDHFFASVVAASLTFWTTKDLRFSSATLSEIAPGIGGTGGTGSSPSSRTSS